MQRNVVALLGQTRQFLVDTEIVRDTSAAVASEIPSRRAGRYSQTLARRLRP
jgi:hypothetical protein